MWVLSLLKLAWGAVGVTGLSRSFASFNLEAWVQPGFGVPYFNTFFLKEPL